ncbi:MAG TPA: hypothetical protein VMN39_03295, partial [Longimicrobiaceae bacterium]|nr:hypothetical protein [Longimicrobiaceae bacterium]
EEKPLVSNEDVGWMFGPQYSPDGTKVAVYWNRRPDAGLWVIALRNGEQTPVGLGEVMMLGWSPEGEWVYGFREESSQIVRYSITDHSAVVVATIECGKSLRMVSMTPDAKRFVCAGGEEQSDLWIAENVKLTGRVER